MSVDAGRHASLAAGPADLPAIPTSDAVRAALWDSPMQVRQRVAPWAVPFDV